MTCLLEMVQSASRASVPLGASAPLCSGFVVSQQNPDGGFCDRAGKSDVYYTAFALCALAALTPTGGSSESGRGEGTGASPWAGARRFLESFAGGEGLDFVHLCCLARAWGVLAFLDCGRCPVHWAEGILGRIEGHRSRDGGYHPRGDQDFGTAYAAYLALGAYQDLGGRLPATGGLKGSVDRLRIRDSGWVNELASSPCAAPPAVNATSAAVSVLTSLGQPVEPSAAGWLLAQASAVGGFLAFPKAPVPDLLSTATALHTLAMLGQSTSSVAGKCLDFIDSLWTSEGSFYGHWADDHLDCEYTFYGLLSLGHLAGAVSGGRSRAPVSTRR